MFWKYFSLSHNCDDSSADVFIANMIVSMCMCFVLVRAPGGNVNCCLFLVMVVWFCV